MKYFSKRSKTEKHLFYYSFERVLNIFSTIISTYLIARSLGPEGFGEFNYCFNWFIIFNIFSIFGIDGIMIRRIASKPEKLEVVLISGTFIIIVGSIIASLILVMYAFYFDYKYFSIFILFPIIYFLNVFVVFNYANQALEKGNKNLIAFSISILCAIILRIYLSKNNASYKLFLFSYIFEYCITYVILIFRANFKIYSKLRIKEIYNESIDIFKESWPLVFSSFSILLFTRFDQILIKRISSNFELGIYSASYRVIEGLYVLPSIILGGIFPKLVILKLSDPIKFVRFLRKFVGLHLVYSFSIFILLFFWGELILGIIYGGQFKGSKTVLYILSINVFLSGFGMLFSRLALLESLNKLTFLNNLLGMIISLTLNYYLIKKLGGIGAAITSVITQSFTCIFFWQFSKRLSNWTIKIIKFKHFET